MFSNYQNGVKMAEEIMRMKKLAEKKKALAAASKSNNKASDKPSVKSTPTSVTSDPRMPSSTEPKPSIWKLQRLSRGSSVSLENNSFSKTTTCSKASSNSSSKRSTNQNTNNKEPVVVLQPENKNEENSNSKVTSRRRSFFSSDETSSVASELTKTTDLLEISSEERDLSASPVSQKATTTIAATTDSSTSLGNFLDFRISFVIDSSWDTIRKQDHFQADFSEQVFLRMMELDSRTRQNLQISSLRSDRFVEWGRNVIEIVDTAVVSLGPDMEEFDEEFLRLGQECQQWGIQIAYLSDSVTTAVQSLTRPVDWTEEVERGWKMVMGFVAEKMAATLV